MTIRRIFQWPILVAGLLLISIGPTNAHVAHLVPDGIVVSLTPSQAQFDVDDAVLLQVAYRNVTDQAIEMLRWGTALEGRINADFLAVSFEGTELPYLGRHYKRAPPLASDYVTIPAGSSISGEVDLLDAYPVDYRGRYQIRSRTASFATHQQRLFVAPLEISLTGDRAISFRVTPIVNNCDSNRANLIDSALSAAESMARQARDDLRNTPQDKRAEARRYREWFGGYGLSRWNTVQDHFDRIYSAASSRQITFICDNAETAFAYVYPSDPYKIYLGQAFWSAPRTGTDSKAGTIIHELSHFTVLGGTDDFVYGQSAARSLANSNPNNAVRNADNHEYFAENTPSLPMPEPQPEPDPEPPAPPPPPPPPPAIIQILKLLLLDEEG